MIQSASYNWDESTNLWVGNWKYESYFDNYDKNTHELQYYWSISAGNWVIYRKKTLHYSEQIINDIGLEKIGLTPNPVSDYLSFIFSGKSNSAIIELYDTQGRKLINKQIYKNEELSLEFLNSGMYLYILYFDGNMQSGKLLKK